jgi:ADP-heptose:LPS heptosyltransferase
MKLCKVVVCQDSGPMHVASAVGAKTIVLFGSTNPKRKAPLRNCTVIWKDEDKYDDYYEVYGKERRKNVKFMEDISVEDVLACIS